MSASRQYAWDLHSVRVAFDVSSASDKGLVRRLNEDSFVASPPIFLVADGMGGHAFGDRASREVARVLGGHHADARPATPQSILVAVAEANRAVRAISEDEFAGTTLAGIAVVQTGDAAVVHWMAFNVGDSRVYSWDGATLSQVTVDHSAVQELVEDGLLTPAEAAVHPDRNVITRAIGIDGEVEPDVWLLPAAGNQCFLICSDGLTKELDDRAIAEVLAANSEVSAADRLVAAALASGGADNVTVIVVSTEVESLTTTGVSDVHTIPAHLEETLPRP
jgi:serine/threonine protein phosphatase PrpC